MSDSVTYSVSYTDTHAILLVTTLELDLEHADTALALEVHDRELVFTAPPYHVRIPVDRDLLRQDEVFPEQIDYEKSMISYHIPLVTKAQVESAPEALFPYGFNNSYSGPLNIINNQEFKSLSNPERFSNEERHQKRITDEKNDFNTEHFGMDHVQCMIDYFGLDTAAIKLEAKLTEDQTYRIKVILSDKKDDLDRYRTLAENGTILLNLLDILLAVLYDKLLQGDELNEAISHVNIHRISATLSYFEQLSSVEAVLTAFYRRCCIYPLFRSKELAQICAQHLVNASKKEAFKDWILEKLMYCYESLMRNDCSILNHYYIKDYIRFAWLCTPVEGLRKISEEVAQIMPQVHDRPLGFGEEVVVQKMVHDIIGRLDESSTDSDDDSSSEDETETESSDEDVIPQPEESVLDKLMNLKIQP
uniref:Protein SHQ1 homolog n=1 Tax=Culex tarsalis TaxID=7177 RepID=A0A1Q3FVJ4_CULTA